MSRSRFLAVAGASAALALLLAGCSGGGSGSGGTAAPGQAGAGKQLALIDLYANSYTTNIAAGSKAAADQDGAGFTQLGPVGLDPNKAIADFQNTVASGTVGVLAMAFPSEVWSAPIDKAIDQGVTVVTSDVATPDSKALTHVGPGKVSMGAALADAYLKQLPKDTKGTLVPGICVAGLPVLEAPLTGFTDRIEQERPGITVIDPEVTAADMPGNFAAWQRIQAKYPDALGFVGSCDQDLTNMLKMKEAVNGKFLIGTTAGGDDPEAAAAISGGQMVGAVSQRGWLQGYVGMKLIANHVFRNEALPTGWVNTGFDIVSQDNAADMVKVLKDPAAAESLYKALGDKLVKDSATASLPAVDFTLDEGSIGEPNPKP